MNLFGVCYRTLSAIGEKPQRLISDYLDYVIVAGLL